jgi:hypothetical protein
MKALIVGGDSIEPVRRKLQAQGYQNIDHWEGRKTGDCRRAFPRNLDLVVIMLSYVNHNLCKRVRMEADRHDWPIMYCGRKSATQDIISS